MSPKRRVFHVRRGTLLYRIVKRSWETALDSGSLVSFNRMAKHVYTMHLSHRDIGSLNNFKEWLKREIRENKFSDVVGDFLVSYHATELECRNCWDNSNGKCRYAPAGGSSREYNVRREKLESRFPEEYSCDRGVTLQRQIEPI